MSKQKGERLNALRERAGVTQRELAEALGVTDQTVSNWERGVKTMKLTPEQTLIFCQKLNCKLEELVYESRKRNDAKSSN